MSSLDNRQWIWRDIQARKDEQRRRESYRQANRTFDGKPGTGAKADKGVSAIASRARQAPLRLADRAAAFLRQRQPALVKTLRLPPGAYGLKEGEQKVVRDGTGQNWLVIADENARARSRHRSALR